MDGLVTMVVRGGSGLALVVVVAMVIGVAVLAAIHYVRRWRARTARLATRDAEADAAVDAALRAVDEGVERDEEARREAAELDEARADAELDDVGDDVREVVERARANIRLQIDMVRGANGRRGRTRASWLALAAGAATLLGTQPAVGQVIHPPVELDVPAYVAPADLVPALPDGRIEERDGGVWYGADAHLRYVVVPVTSAERLSDVRARQAWHRGWWAAADVYGDRFVEEHGMRVEAEARLDVERQYTERLEAALDRADGFWRSGTGRVLVFVGGAATGLGAIWLAGGAT